MKAEGPCLDCGRWVVFYGRQRCQRCNQRARRNTPPAPCPRCGTVGMVWPEVNCCGRCSFLEWRRTSVDRTRECVACGEVKWISCRGMCSACRQRDPEWPYRYAANLETRLGALAPKWLDAYVVHLAERFVPSVTMDHLRKLRAAIETTGTSTPSRVAAGLPAGRYRLVFGEYCMAAGIGFVADPAPEQAALRRRARIEACPPSWRAAVEGFSTAMVARQDRARRLGTRADADRTIEARLSVLRNFALFLDQNRRAVTGPELVTIAEIEAFLAQPDLGFRPSTALAYLRQFFGWARRRSLVLVDPTVGLWRDAKPVFAGEVLSTERQRELFQRWSDPPAEAHPYEPLIGLLALLHAVPRADLVALRVDGIADTTIELASRPEPLALDPVTADALARARRHQAGTGTRNPHLLVNQHNRGTSRPVGRNWPSTLVAQATGHNLRQLRATRLSALVGDLDPITISAAVGIDAKALIYYLDEAPPRDHEPLQVARRSRQVGSS